MKRYAIDVVILPPAVVTDQAIQWNKSMRNDRPENIALNTTDCLPHISLIMGCLADDQLEYALAILQSIAQHNPVMELSVTGLNIQKVPSGDPILSFDIERSAPLMRLHGSIVAAFSPLLTPDATEAEFFGAPPIHSPSIEWVNQYIPYHCLEQFWPHITIGFGHAPGSVTPYIFPASRVALCHLGNHCTCRKILGEVILGS